MDLWLIFAMLAVAFKETVPLTTIETIPPTQDNLLATGYSGLVVRATIKKTTSTTNCGWRYDGDTSAPEGEVERLGGLQFHIVGIGCVNRTSSSRQSITCVEREIDGVTHIITNLTYLQPLTSDLVLAVRCNNGADLIIALPTKTLRDCPHNFPNGVIASTSQFDFNTTGTFQCNNGGILFYPIGSRATLLPNHTTCLYTAEWSEQEAIQYLQCWTAPQTKISKDTILNVIEGNDLTITCQYNDVVPQGTSSIIYFNENAEVIGKDEMFIIPSLQLDDDTKQIYCQAVTPYTQLYNATGRSPNYTINVQYIGSQVTYEVLPGPHLIKTKDGYLLKSGQPLSLSCSSYGNPEPKCNFNICSNGRCIDIDNPQNRCEIISMLSFGGSLSCRSFNNAGSRTTGAQSIAIVQQTRFPLISQNGNMTQSETLQLRRGEPSTISCNIDNSDEMNTSFTWRTKNDETIFNSELFLPSTFDNIGNYTCSTNDAFGRFSKSVSIDVLSAPYQDSQTTCAWVVQQAGFCAISFFSNPEAEVVSLYKNGVVVDDFLWRKKFVTIRQTFYYIKDPVTAEDNGRYQLILRSTEGRKQNHQIEFEVVASTTKFSCSNASFHTAVSFAVIFAVITLAFGLYLNLKKRKHGNVQKKVSMEPAYAVEGEDNYIEFRSRPSQVKSKPPKAQAEQQSTTSVKGVASGSKPDKQEQKSEVYENAETVHHYQCL